MDMLLGYDWLVKHNLEVNWNKDTIQFIRYTNECKIQNQNISFKFRIRRIILMKEIDHVLLT